MKRLAEEEKSLREDCPETQKLEKGDSWTPTSTETGSKQRQVQIYGIPNVTIR